MNISVIIPTLNAERDLPALLAALGRQTLRAAEILIVDSESDDRTAEIAAAAARGAAPAGASQGAGSGSAGDAAGVGSAGAGLPVRVIPIRRADFDHGKTRDMALRASVGDVVIFLTQDAIPADEGLIEQLVRPLAIDGVAVATGRQLPRADATPMEKRVRGFNYPPESRIRSEADVRTMGIKAFYCSDVCAAYNREIYLQLGGFDWPLKTNEDMFFAARAIRGGYRVAYAAEARVIHSHNLTLREQYRRNRIQGYEIERHRALLGEVSPVSEGWKMVRTVAGGLIREGRLISFMHFGLDCFARLLGSRAGRRDFLKNKGNTRA